MSTTFPQPPANPTLRPKSSSMGAKFFLLFALAVLMSVPGLFVNGLADSRAQQRGAVTTYNNGTPQPPHTVLGMRMADSYRSIHRSLKYITLFLGLVFITYFLFEVTTDKRVHPGQYALVGIAQTIFYLLLLSLTEIVGFDFGFLIAGAATVLLFSMNTAWLFVSRKLGLRAFGVFSLLYAFIYVLLRLENYALLVGSCASFAAIAATMYFTRNIDWYSSGGNYAPAPAGGPPTARESWLR
ncbi:inner membrane CreD family protein [Granulicella sp. S156]|uniref:inner membrane CreD family protein n=1 Tax=Granulicella sp. S156 TaxID=1747224 RepID=UPI00131D716F|nr:inner membrane CreD family protein [Granulicella sp. S156]